MVNVKRNKFENVCLFFPFRLMISVFSLFFFWFYRYRHRCSTLIDPPYPLHPATRFERFAARYVKRERVFFPLTNARSPLTSAYRAHTMFYVYACICVRARVRVEGEPDIFLGYDYFWNERKIRSIRGIPSFPIYERTGNITSFSYSRLVVIVRPPSWPCRFEQSGTRRRPKLAWRSSANVSVRSLARAQAHDNYRQGRATRSAAKKKST